MATPAHERYTVREFCQGGIDDDKRPYTKPTLTPYGQLTKNTEYGGSCFEDDERRLRGECP